MLNLAPVTFNTTFIITSLLISYSITHQIFSVCISAESLHNAPLLITKFKVSLIVALCLSPNLISWNFTHTYSEILIEGTFTPFQMYNTNRGRKLVHHKMHRLSQSTHHMWNVIFRSRAYIYLLYHSAQYPTSPNAITSTRWQTTLAIRKQKKHILLKTSRRLLILLYEHKFVQYWIVRTSFSRYRRKISIWLQVLF